MAEGVLGLGSGQAAALNSDLLNKLKEAESKAVISPIEKRIENIGTEKEKFSEIETKVSEFLASVKPFDLFISNGLNAFEQKTASTSGESVTFDAPDVTKLAKGFTSIDVTQLAQKDVYQSNAVNSTIKDTVINAGDLEITVNGNKEIFNTTGKTYDDLAKEINAKSGINATVEQVGTNSYRLLIKSEESGLDNALTIGGTASQTLGYTTDGTVVNSTNHILEAKNMIAKVDGLEYSVSSNTITVGGLKMTANKEGISSINIDQDNSQIETQLNSFITKYNELVAMIDGEVFGADSKIDDKSAIRDIVTQVKSKLFGSYGTSNDKSIFNYGIEIDKTGRLSLNSKKFTDAVENDLAGLKELFIGVAEKKGLGTTLKETLDNMSFSGGVLDTYTNNMSTRETRLNEEKEKAQKLLDSRYSQLAQQFAAYGSIINQMEASFSGLKMLIQQSVSSNS